MKVYISGPITGILDHNKKYFEMIANSIMVHGDTAVSPIIVGERLAASLGREPTWQEYMREDVRALLECDYIFMLDGWENSNGARAERFIAHNVGIKTYHL